MRRPGRVAHWLATLVCGVALGLGCALVIWGLAEFVTWLIRGWETTLQVLFTVGIGVAVIWAGETVTQHGVPWNLNKRRRRDE